jgi:hypothetical protein
MTNLTEKLTHELVKLADLFDRKSLFAAANRLDRIIRQLAKKNGPVLDGKTRNKINDALDKISTGTNHKYYKSVGEAFELIANALKTNQVVILMEDNTEFSGFWSGKSGRETLDLAPADPSKTKDDIHESFSNTMLVMSWHKVDNGTFEVIAYLS